MDQLLEYSSKGIDGLALYFIDYDAELAEFDARVMPLLREAGLRR